ncbi:MAG: hypothetical protein OIF32_11890, partial [Campylobacterales bacterium]|nr:hypothetical protein [Campylobacterales bacterium]
VLLKDMYYYDSPIYSDTTTFGDTLDDVFYQEYDEENNYETNKEFFLEGFENGKQILKYIEENKNPDILNTLEPTLLRKLAFEKKLYIYKRFEYYGSGGFSFGTDLEQDVSLEDILEKFIAPYYDPDSFYIQNDGEAKQIEKCLRCVDVLMRLLGKKELNSDEMNILTDDFELCYKKEARQRFSIQALDTDELKESIYELMNDPFCDSLGIDKLDEIHEYYKKDPKLFASILDDIIEVSYESIDEDILAVMPSLNQNEYAKGAQLIPVAYILYKESNSFIKSKDLDPLWEFYTNNIFKSFIRELAGTYSNKLDFRSEKYEKKPIYLEKIEEYIDSQEEKSSGGFFAKFMKKEEKGEEKISKEEALEYAKELLAVDTQEEIVHSSLFSSDNISMLLASMLYVVKVAPTPLKKKLISAYELVLELFPSKTLLVSFYEFRENGEFLSDATSEEIEAFYDYLVDIGFDEKYSFILKILIIQKQNNYKNSIELFDNEYGLRNMYVNLLETYRAKDEIDEDEPAMFRRRQEQINKA